MSGCINPQNNKHHQEQDLHTQTIPNLPLRAPPMHHPEATDPFLPLAARSTSLVFPPHNHPDMMSPVLPWQLPPAFSPAAAHHDPFLFPPSSTTATFGRRSAGPQHHHHLQFSAYDIGGPSSSDPLRILSEALGQPGAAPFGLQMQAELNRMSAQEIMDAKALAASKSHSEAERRRRERINNHLAKLRSLLPSTTKTDKASLLAEVIQHVKELKRQTSAIAEASAVPSESDELTVDPEAEFDADGRVVVKASLCCDDRSDLLPDLIKALKALRLRTLKAEITTLGGRVKNVLFVTGEDAAEEDGSSCSDWSVGSIQEALRAVMEKSSTSSGGRDDSASGNAKRQRTNSNANIIT